MFDYADFQRDPEKYRLFKTAILAHNLFTNNGEHDLEAGTILAIRYSGTVRNQLYKRDEPIYACRTTLDGPENWTLYAGALTGFCL